MAGFDGSPCATAAPGECAQAGRVRRGDLLSADWEHCSRVQAGGLLYIERGQGGDGFSQAHGLRHVGDAGGGVGRPAGLGRRGGLGRGGAAAAGGSPPGSR